ncbi:hypothetical protein [Microbulbifer hydrolyticus]|uniref:Fumarate reductase subunit C n=1 Tax=Microbulbifer hydrolyticus TaxID=48074 RepID=A0ABX6IYI0_9GAMM|nr:hypothetical protein [Microbulbifer hydrolyticus]QHQ38592.1 hypothetical protein GTQ55_06060 [Microbulbifer hydrolyticus]
MSILKIHRAAAWICLGLFPIGFLIGGWEDSYEQTQKGIKYMFMVGGIYLPFYCARVIHLGRMPLIGYPSTVLEKQRDPVLFWFLIGLYIFTAIVGVTTPLR